MTNQGRTRPAATWFDSVYLSADALGRGDLLFGRVQHVGDVVGGASYTQSVTAPSRACCRATTTSSSAATSAITSPSRTRATTWPPRSTAWTSTRNCWRSACPRPAPSHRGSPPTSAWTSAGETLLLDLDSAAVSGFNEVYVAFNRVPTRADFDFAGIEPFATDQRVVVPATQSGTYFVLVVSNNTSGTPTFDIEARLLEFEVLHRTTVVEGMPAI